MRKSRACLPTSKGIRARSPWYRPWAAKQYWQLRLQVWATWRHRAFSTGLVWAKASCSTSFHRSWEKELAGGLQGVDVLQAGQDLPPRPRLPGGRTWPGSGRRWPPGGGLVQGDDVIGHLVHQVDRAAVHVQDDVVAVEFVLMDHKRLVVPSAPRKKCRLIGPDQAAAFSVWSVLSAVAVFALLVGKAAGGLAGRLAGGLAFAATAGFQALGQVRVSRVWILFMGNRSFLSWRAAG